MTPSQISVNLICSFEGCKLVPYNDQVGIPTIGYGSRYYENGKEVSLGDPAITESRAKELLLFHISTVYKRIAKNITATLTQNELDAVISLVYNIGENNFKKSTLLRLLNKGEKEGTANQFLVWNKAGGIVVAGLKRRREAERLLFLK